MTSPPPALLKTEAKFDGLAFRSAAEATAVEPARAATTQASVTEARLSTWPYRSRRPELDDRPRSADDQGGASASAWLQAKRGRAKRTPWVRRFSGCWQAAGWRTARRCARRGPRSVVARRRSSAPDRVCPARPR